MSLMGTLAKVAIGIAVAKGVSSMMGKKAATGAGGGDSYGGRHSPGGAGGGLVDAMGEVLAGRRSPSPSSGGGTFGGSGSGGGLGDFLDELGRYAPDAAAGAPAGRGSAGRGGLDDLIGSLGGGSAGGGLGDLLGGVLGGGQGRPGGGLGDLLGGILGGGAAAGRGGSFGDLLNQSFGNRGEPDATPSPEQNAVAGLMLRAMIQAAKADGRIDADEQRRLLGNLGEVTAQEKRFVEAEMKAPVDPAGLARQVPRGLETQVYTMALMAIDLDNRTEANFLHRLAQGMGLDERVVNAIHTKLGAPALYA